MSEDNEARENKESLIFFSKKSYKIQLLSRPMFISRIKVSASDNERGRKRGPSAARRRSSRPGTEPRHPVLMTDFLGGGVAWGGGK